MSDVISGSFTATGQSDVEALYGDYALSLSGFGAGTVALERSFDDGSTWVTVEEYTANTEKTIEARGHQVRYRLNCSAYTSGTIVYVIRS